MVGFLSFNPLKVRLLAGDLRTAQERGASFGGDSAEGLPFSLPLFFWKRFEAADLFSASRLQLLAAMLFEGTRHLLIALRGFSWRVKGPMPAMSTECVKRAASFLSGRFPLLLSVAAGCFDLPNLSLLHKI